MTSLRTKKGGLWGMWISGLLVLVGMAMKSAEAFSGMAGARVRVGNAGSWCRDHGHARSRVMPPIGRPCTPQHLVKHHRAAGTRRHAAIVSDVKPLDQDLQIEKARRKFVYWAVDTLKISSVDANALFDLATLESRDVGQFLIKEGPEDLKKAAGGRKLYFVLDGQVSIEVRGNRVNKLGSGSFIGESSFVSGRRGPRSVTAICSGEDGAVFLAWEFVALRRFLENKGQLSATLTSYWLRQLADKLNATMRTYERAWSPEGEIEAEELKYGADYGFRNFRVGIQQSKEHVGGDDAPGPASLLPSDPLARATPGSWVKLAQWNFKREYQALRRAIRFDEFGKGRRSLVATTNQQRPRYITTNHKKPDLNLPTNQKPDADPIKTVEHQLQHESRGGARDDHDKIARAPVIGSLLRATSDNEPIIDLGIDVPRVVLKAVLGVFAVADMILEKVGLFPVLRPPKAFMSKDPKVVDLQTRLQQLTLSNEAIFERERRRRELQGELIAQGMTEGLGMAAKYKQISTPWFILAPYFLLCWILDVVFDGRPIARFWFLETVARMPYFSYISMLHFYETMGWWSVGTDVRKVHFAEEWNEMHHLRMMEALGGDALWFDRFFARHAAIVYYWLLNTVFLLSPRLAYNFSELIESHAVDTYSEFVDANEELLKQLPAPTVAIEYYMLGDLYLFDEFQTARKAYTRRPVVRSLYDVFCNIRDDELEHVRTVNACQVADNVIVSPNAAAANAGWAMPSNAEDEELLDEELEADWARGASYDALGEGGRPWDGPGEEEDDLGRVEL